MRERVRMCDTLREAIDFASGKKPTTYWSGYGPVAQNYRPLGPDDAYRKIDSTEAAQLAETFPHDCVFIGSRPVGSRPGEVVIQERTPPEVADPDDDSMAYLRRD